MSCGGTARCSSTSANFAADEPKPVASFEFGNRRLEKIAAKFADVLEQRAVPPHDIAPEVACGKFVGHYHRRSGRQHAAWSDHATDAVEQRQAIEQSIIRRCAG